MVAEVMLALEATSFEAGRCLEERHGGAKSLNEGGQSWSRESCSLQEEARWRQKGERATFDTTTALGFAKAKLSPSLSESKKDLGLAGRIMELAHQGAQRQAEQSESEKSLGGAAVDFFRIDEASPEELEPCLKLILLALKLLKRCGYPKEDVVLIAAHATAYLEKVFATLQQGKPGRPKMELVELAQVFCLLLYLAHVHVEDEHCQLEHWHKWLSRNYCDLSTLNSAVLSILETLQFTLRVEDTDLDRRLGFLRGSTLLRDR